MSSKNNADDWVADIEELIKEKHRKNSVDRSQPTSVES
jgi:hypothetical protein